MVGLIGLEFGDRYLGWGQGCPGMGGPTREWLVGFGVVDGGLNGGIGWVKGVKSQLVCAGQPGSGWWTLGEVAGILGSGVLYLATIAAHQTASRLGCNDCQK